ncbi:MAG TPA: molybdopterin-dependent oxidoreductase [Pseudolysinimonas sp.]|nr:molybdopterin-dependent oxidoreductase [Pseudolysinimonas sp.]
MTAPRWMLPAAAGVASVALGLGVAELAAALVAPSASPLFVVGSLVIDLAPPWAKQTMIALFGTGDKAALLTLMGIGLVVLAAGVGVLQARRPPLGRIAIGVGAIVGVGAALTRSGAAALDAVPAVVAAVVAAIALGLLLRKAPEAGAPARGTEVPTRRAFLGWAGGATALGLLATGAGVLLEAGTRAATAVREAFTLPRAAVRAAPVPAGADLGIPDLSPVVTPNAQFYRIDTALQIPRINPSEWSLKITGMVEQEVEISWAELIALPMEESYTTLMCVSNEVGGSLIGNALWLGYPIRHILERARPASGADMVLSRSIDGFTAGTPLTVLQEEDRNAILAIGMNGEPLPEEHGFPVRMVVPGLYGYVSATKWLIELEVTRFDEASAYWTDRGWGAKGPVKIESRIDVARGGAGEMTVAGVAWHQHTGISGVEVQVDGGPWEAATLAEAISIDTWVQWRYDFAPAKGEHEVRVRATGSDGKVQTGDVADVLPDGATGYHTVRVTAA